MVEQAEGGGAAAGRGADVVRLTPHGAALPLTETALSGRHHLTLSILHVHRPFNSVPAGGGGRDAVFILLKR